MKKVYVISSNILLFLIVIISYNFGNRNIYKKNTTNFKEMRLPSDEPFLNHRSETPSIQQYKGSFFELSHNYPTTVKSIGNTPWQKALKGKPISESNVFAYMDSLKNYIKPRVLPFLINHKGWTAAKYGWFNEPWLGPQRDAILGAYLGNGNPKYMFKSLKEDEAGYVLVLYDSTAAYTLEKIWGKTAENINLLNDATQFAEGSVILKLAFSNINYPQWPVMQGAETFQIYDTFPTSESPKKGFQMRKVSFFQIDVIVKDSKTSPKTGWVYSTFVYDMNATGTLWEKMVPLGAMWGNDPDVNSPLAPPYPKLSETVINEKAPPYSKETLGWGGRLSGPNDGAIAQEAVNVTTGEKYKNLALSSCMSCHIPAQDLLKSFLLPGPPAKKTDTVLYVFTPGSPQWNSWFKDNYGNIPFDSGQVATDYDLVMAFKSVRAYNTAHPSLFLEKSIEDNIKAIENYRRHNTRSQFWH
jgi:hypothetical protein